MSGSPVPGSRLVGPTLCIVVLLLMIVAVMFAAWISLVNYSKIGV